MANDIFGGELNIQGLEDGIDRIEKKMTNLSRNFTTNSNKIINAFRDINANGVQQLVNKLGELQTALTNISSKNANLGNVGSGASKSVDEITKLTDALAKLKAINSLKLKTDKAKRDYLKEANDIKEVVIQEKERTRELERQNKLNIELNNKRLAVDKKGESNLIRQEMNAQRQKERALIEADAKDKARHKDRMVRLRQQIDEINRLAKAYKAMPTNISTKSVGGLIGQSVNATSINQRITAINNMKNALKDLDTTTEKGKRTEEHLTSEIKRQTTELRKQGVNLDDVKNKKRSLMNTTDQLQRKLALLFSVSAIQGYINKLATVRGEFELQQKSLNVLLKNKAQADKLWNQTVQLAVQSPFRVSELVKYTKQLAAYRIETDKLHATTKMLADVSAGLGVDMQRLILAYGQIKAAGFLRGTEVRQLTEAGVSVYEELAKHFTKMENTDVTVAQVIQRISKRQVAFKDVEQIFKNITSEGGAFYEMQEQQANTLKGMISNLRDSIDLMLNDIGKSNESTLKGFVSITKEIIENWRILAVVIKSVSIALAGVALKSFATGWAMVATEGAAAAAAMNGMVGVGARLNIMFKSLTTTISANPILAIAGLIGAGVLAWHDYSKSIDEANQVHNENIKSLIDLQEGLTDIEKKIKKNNKTIQTYNALEKNASATSEELALAEKQKNDAYTENIQLFDTLKEKYPELYSSITKQKDGVISLNDAIKEQNELLEYEILLQTKGKASTWHDSVNTNAKEATEAWNEYQSKLADVRGVARDAQAKLKELKNTGRYSKEEISSVENYIKVIEKLGKEGYKDVDYIRIRGEAWKQMTDVMKAQMSSIHLSISDATRYAGDAFGSYERAFNNLVENFQRQAPAWQESLSKMLLDPDKGEQRARDFVKKQLDAFGLYREDLRQMAFDEIIGIAQIKVKLTYDTPEREAEDETEGMLLWQKQLWAIIEKIKAKNPNITIPIKPQDLINGNKEEILEKVRKFAKEVIETSENAIKGYNVKGQKVYDETDKKRNEETKGLGEELLSAAGGFKKKNTGGRKSDPAKELAKVMQDMFREYEKMNDKFSKETSENDVAKYFEQTFKEATKQVKGFNLALDNFDFTTFDGLINALTTLKKFAKDEKTGREIGQIISNLQTEKETTKIDKTIEAREREVELLYEQYDLYKDLKKQGVSTALAKNLFNIDVTNIDELAKGINEIFTKKHGSDTEWGEDIVKAYQDAMDKIAKMGKDARVEQLKQYVKLERDGFSERIKAYLESSDKQKEIDETFAPSTEMLVKFNIDESKLDNIQKLFQGYLKGNNVNFSALTISKDQVKELEEYFEYLKEGKEYAQNGINKVLQESLVDIEVKEFKDSALYDVVFGDFEKLSEASIKIVKEKLKDLQTQLKNAGVVDDAKLQELLNKLNDAERKAAGVWATYKADKKAVEGTYNDGLYKAYQENGGKETGVNAWIKIYADELTKVANLEKEIADLTKERENIGGNLNEDQQRRLTNARKELNDAKGNVTTAEENIEKHKKLTDSQKNLIKSGQAWGDALMNVLGNADQLADALGQSEDSSARMVIKMLQGFVSIGMQILSLIVSLEAMGLALNSALGIIGLIGIALSAIVTAVSIFASSADDTEKINAEIERQQQLVDRLNREYDRLQKNLDKMSTFAGFQKMSESIENLRKQQRSYERMIDLEYSKKDSDASKIQEYIGNITDIAEKIADVYEDLRNTLIDDFKDISEELADAMLSALKEGEDAISAWGESVDEIVQNLVKKIVVAKLIEPEVEKLIDEYYNSLMPRTSKAEEWAKAETEATAIWEKYAKAYANIPSDKDAGSWSDLIGADLYNIMAKLDKQKNVTFDEFYEAVKDFLPQFTKDQIRSIFKQRAWDEYGNWSIHLGDTLVALLSLMTQTAKAEKDNAQKKHDEAERAAEGEEVTFNQEASDKLSEELEKLGTDVFDQLPDYVKAMFEESASSLTGLQKGIQGITESTAQVLEGYLNSIRFYVAQDNGNLNRIVEMLTTYTTTNPMLSELKAQTEVVRSIRDMFAGVIRSGHPTFGGSFIKVAL